jgi:tRNA 2-thiouridine synthesizing protein A
MSGEHMVDARGMLCPWPVLRLARSARELGPGPIRLLADDPAAPAEVEQLCRERGWKFAQDPSDGQAFNVVIC